ncbi:helix-turn-helix domain-containing protein [Pedobacter sp. LMG 31464]|uniref:Helix-turn-helix domain-containing protein n=1 Tax=Pedobacter planticolens TaxID=2679964 RepID=A0A923DU83_9SPHI|nr:helix-turn-helix domain-containing protein [Pedobacter planticolens]MBB2143946.1 helix-turn-helix domain-containing protein [Pedobacter planticolens]
MYSVFQVMDSALPDGFSGQNQVLFVLRGDGHLSIGATEFSYTSAMAFAFKGDVAPELLSGRMEVAYLVCFSDKDLEDFVLRYPLARNVAREVRPWRLNLTKERIPHLEQELGLLKMELVLGTNRERLRLLFSLLMLQLFEGEIPARGSLTGKKDLIDEFRESLERYFRLQRSTRFYARKLAVSSRRLNGLCKDWYAGKRMFEVVLERICLEAEILLLDIDIPIKAVAYELGFSSTQHFRVYFKRFRGMSPSEFRFGLEKT